MTEVKTTVEGSVISGIVGTQKCADSGSVDPMENDECVICLDAVKKRGRIECCDHKFCFECIKKWSKVTNKCPVCKRDFSRISEVVVETASKGKRKRATKGKVIKVQSRTQRSDMHYHPPMNPAMMRGFDIRELMLMRFLRHPHHMIAGLMDYDDNDSDYEEDEEDRTIGFNSRHQRRLARVPPSPPPPVVTQDIIENGHRVIEILDDDDSAWPRVPASRGNRQREAGASGASTSRPGGMVRRVGGGGSGNSGGQGTGRGPRGLSLFQPVTTSRYVAGSRVSEQQNAEPRGSGRGSRRRVPGRSGGGGSAPVVVILDSDSEGDTDRAVGSLLSGGRGSMVRESSNGTVSGRVPVPPAVALTSSVALASASAARSVSSATRLPEDDADVVHQEPPRQRQRRGGLDEDVDDWTVLGDWFSGDSLQDGGDWPCVHSFGGLEGMGVYTDHNV